MPVRFEGPIYVEADPVESDRPLPPRKSRLRAGSAACAHLGDVIRLEDCKTCRGTVRVKVFACHHPDHADTTLAFCRTCPDYEGEEGPAMMAIPATMVPPSRKRKGIWRNGILQIMVTRACDLACHHCTQGSNLAGRPVVMTPEQFEQAVASLEGYFGVIGVFGGNPCLSPHFEDYCRILRARVPFEQRGLWCNHPRGKGALARITFNPKHSNLNCHMNGEAYAEFARDWPESVPYLKGMDQDSIHGPPFVAMKDVIDDEAERWRLIGDCDVNKHWSALIGVVPGKGLRAFFCEIAYAQAALHADNPDWDGTGQPMPDTGLPVTPGWWRKPMADFSSQVLTHCHNCGIPLRRPGQLAIGGEREEFSETHRHIARPKVRGRVVEFVGIESLMRSERPATEYLPNVTPGYRGQ